MGIKNAMVTNSILEQSRPGGHPREPKQSRQTGILLVTGVDLNHFEQNISVNDWRAAWV